MSHSRRLTTLWDDLEEAESGTWACSADTERTRESTPRTREVRMVRWSRDWRDGVRGEGWLEDGANPLGVWVCEWNE
jgi:hypothetical protein